MKNAVRCLVFVLVATALIGCSAHETSTAPRFIQERRDTGPRFLRVGRTYFVRGQFKVKLIEHGGGSWYKVEAFPDYYGARKGWLNFDQLDFVQVVEE